MKYDFKEWSKAAGVRAVKTMAQAAVATIGAHTLISEINWAVVASASVMAGVLSLLTSVAGLPEVETKIDTDISPEITDEEVIDTTVEDAELQGNLVSDYVER